MVSEITGQESSPADGGVSIEVFFDGDEVLRIGRMRRAEADCKFSTFVHDLAMRTVAEWEAEQANQPAPASAAD